ncbi:hypothetical protein [Arthrobacter bambusae]|uniref:hypothetical protein n=1 Tax=Arthrobacter bambusae TaxID=1338426 RepID=UPI00277DB323|nr:hypothetical protein [Arthrobacter bambusae]MDQ0028594.1 hypothetical protein [Arthrobacter bambusae]MDQ0096612.1 hypothetical protein [Arthrobacter bambusae]
MSDAEAERSIPEASTPEGVRPEKSGGRRREAPLSDVPAEVEGSKVDPDFVPDDGDENPNEKRAREHPEETGS